MGLVFDLAEAINVGWSALGGTGAADLRLRLQEASFRRSIARHVALATPAKINKRRLRLLLSDAHFIGPLLLGEIQQGGSDEEGYGQQLAQAGVTNVEVPELAGLIATAVADAIEQSASMVEIDQQARLVDIAETQLHLINYNDDIYQLLASQAGTEPDCSSILDGLSRRSLVVAEDLGRVGDGQGESVSLEEVYVPREIERELRNADTEDVTVVVGDAGNGKTSVLWATFQGLRDAGRVCWLMRASSFEAANAIREGDVIVEQIVLGIECLRRVDHRPAILVDTVDSLLHESADRDRLLVLVDRFVRAGAHVVLTCRPLEYQLLPSTFARRELGVYTDDELKLALALHDDVFSDDERPVAGLAQLRRAVHWDTPMLPLLRRPLTLRMLFEVYAPDSIPPELNAFELFKRFWRSRVEIDRRPGDPIVSDVRNLGASAERLAVELISRGSPSLRAEYLSNPGSLGADLELLRSRGVVSGDGVRVEFFHQAFFEHVAGRAFAVRRSEEAFAALLVRAEARPLDAFLWPVVEQAVLFRLDADADAVPIETRLVAWCEDPQLLAFDAALGVWAQSPVELPRLVEKLVSLVADARGSATRTRSAEQVLGHLGSLSVDRTGEVEALVSAAWSSGVGHLRRQAVELLPMLAGRSVDLLREVVGLMGLTEGEFPLSLRSSVSAIAEAIARAATVEPDWAARNGLQIASALGNGSTLYGNHLVRSLEGRAEELDMPSMLDAWVRPLAEVVPGLDLDATARLLHRWAQASGSSAEDLVERARRESDGLRVGLLKAACRTAQGTSPRPELLDVIFELGPEPVHLASEELAALLAGEPDLLAATLLRLPSLSNEEARGVSSGVCRALAAVPFVYLRGLVELIPDDISDEAWRSQHHLEPLLVAAALAGHGPAGRLLDDAIGSRDVRRQRRLLAAAEALAGQEDRARDLVVKLGVALVRPAAIARLLGSRVNDADETRDIVVRSITNLQSSELPERQELAMRIRRGLVEERSSLERHLSSPRPSLDVDISRKAVQHIMVILRQRVFDNLEDPAQVYEAAVSQLLRDGGDREALYTGLTALAEGEDALASTEKAFDLLAMGEPEGRHIAAVRPILCSLAEVDPELGVNRLLQMARLISTIPRSNSRRDGAQWLFEPAVKTFAGLDPSDVSRAVQELASVEDQVGVTVARAAARALGPSFVETAEDLISNDDLPVATRRKLRELVDPLERSVGSAEWPEVELLIS